MADQRQPTFGSNFPPPINNPPVPGQPNTGQFPNQPAWNQPNQGKIMNPQGNFPGPPQQGRVPPRPGMAPPNFNPSSQAGPINGHSQGNFMPNGPQGGVMNGPPGMPPNSMNFGPRQQFGVGPPPVSDPQQTPVGFPAGQRMPPPIGQGPPMSGPPQMGPGPPMSGTPQIGQGPPQIGPRPPQMGQGPLLMGQRPPQMGQGPPLMGQRPPQMGQGPPLMGQRPPQMGQGPPLMGQGPLQMGQRPIMDQGPPQMGQIPPQIGQRPPQMGQGPQQMGQRPPAVSSGTPTPANSNGIFSPSNRPAHQPAPPASNQNQFGSIPLVNDTQSDIRPDELPVPFHGQAQYSHQIGPSMLLSPGSEPSSNKSSRAPTPISGQTYDALEGQFTPTKQGHPPSPLVGTSQPPSLNQPPANQDIGQRSTGITGRRQYPQAPPQPGENYGAFQPNKPVDPMQRGGGMPPYGNLQASTLPPTLPVSGYQPSTAGYNPNPNPNDLSTNFKNLSFNDRTSTSVNLLNEKNLIQPDGLETVKPNLQHDFKKVHCNPEVFRCTLNAMPQTSSLLNKARLPLGILIHPFKDLSQLPVIQSSVIVRCRSCRTYINPYVHFVDSRRWKCNLCYRVNDLPEEFSFDPVTKTYGDPQRRPEIRSATIEFIAPSEYMLRPPQPAVYLYLLDVSFNAISTGYLNLFCQTLIDELDKIPGDSRTQIGFLCYDRSLYFFNLSEGLSQPQMLIVPDLEDVFLPLPDELLVNLHESKELISDLLNNLPSLFEGNMETGSALGAALQVGYKLMHPTGGRITVMQTVLPTVGQGALQLRESSSQTSAKNIPHLGPATDFYKKLALDCSAQQIAVDLFMLNGQYADIASLSCISKYSAGCIYYYPSFHTIKNIPVTEKYETDLRRYFTRKIGFESVMRIRCTRGLSIHTFHGNFFVRSTDLLSLPNINPDAGFGMQMSIEDTLAEASTVCFQAALLYTSSKGERRIRVHTLCLPVTNNISEVYSTADQQAIISLLAKMAVDRSLTSSMGDARDALMNAAIDSIGSYSTQLNSSQKMGAVVLPHSLRILPLFILGLLKSTGFKGNTNTKTDDRVFALQQFKVLPISYLLQSIYPSLYPVHNITELSEVVKSGTAVRMPPLIQLSSANIDRHGVYIMDTGDSVYMIVGGSVSDTFCQNVLDKPNFMSIPDTMSDLPEMENPLSIDLRNFINYLFDCRSNGSTFLLMRDDSKARHLFYQHMVEDRTESSMSYYEFLQYLQQQIK